MTTTVDDIAVVAAALPTLGRFGFGLELPLPTDSDFLAQVDAARSFIRSAPDPRVTITGRGAYHLKHRAERHAHTYVSVGALVAGAALEGIAPVRNGAGPNCRFEAIR
ncbi:hypothetical protein SRS16CHR_01797 [Variovorax sp. SRS16]|uniref:hypothetical protein n=1 Tax=Variovorax sp. SRS16 TaxID=282217 RepID=UPI001316F254|nr:hypothetical protein [Variovorax sp. SRS16]VTU16522.1 hypothetical protein SRS16CHR_01797 [Variovorax sp. SRS16]